MIAPVAAPAAHATSTPVFELHDVRYNYRNAPALAGVSMTLPAGRRTVLLGANGSGKSTLLHLLDALYFKTSGTFRAFGQAVAPERFEDAAFTLQFRRRVGYVFQNADVQLFNATVFDELAFGPLQLGWSAERVRAAVADMLARMRLEHLKDRTPYRLSGGEKKRVALAAILITDPEVLLLDEPTAGLDPESQSQIIDLIGSWRGSGKTVITATHDLDLVPAIAEDAYVLRAGEVAAHGPVAAILADLPLLQRTHLIHAHRHRHADGTVHTHAHLHGHDHTHPQ